MPVGITSYCNDKHLLHQSTAAEHVDLHALCTADEAAWQIFMGEGRENDRCSKPHPLLSHRGEFSGVCITYNWSQGFPKELSCYTGCYLEELWAHQTLSTWEVKFTCVTTLLFWSQFTHVSFQCQFNLTTESEGIKLAWGQSEYMLSHFVRETRVCFRCYSLCVNTVRAE